MIDLAAQAEVILREAGYQTWTSSATEPPATVFEGASIIGFVNIFSSAAELLATWQDRQRHILSRHAVSLRHAGIKAWNVYSVFLTDEPAGSLARALEQIEEDFSLTRKIARASVRTLLDTSAALLPLAPIRSHNTLFSENFEERLRIRLSNIPADGVAAFFGNAQPSDVAKILAGSDEA